MTRPTTSAMYYAKPDLALPRVLDIISLNYRGEGIRQSPEFERTDLSPVNLAAAKNPYVMARLPVNRKTDGTMFSW